MPVYQLYHAEELKEYMVRFFTKLDVPTEDAAIAADILLAADLRGVESHGLIRLNTYYGDRLRKKLVDPTTPLTVLHESACALSLDGGNGVGLVAGYRAMTRTIEKAKTAGIAITTVRNSNHYGIAGYYAMMALPHNMIGVSFTNAQPLVAPTYGKKAVLGTNPIAVAAPADHCRPWVLDMATSIVPIGRVTVYDKARRDLPLGWGIDSQGQPTTAPSDVLKGGALMPLGGTDVMRGYKGYGLAMLVDIFAGVLAGASFGEKVGQPSSTRTADVGHFFAAISIDAFRPIADFKADMDAYLQELKESPKAAGHDRIYVHGEKEFELAEQRQRTGVPVMQPVVDSLIENGKQIGVEFDLSSLGQVSDDE